MKPNTAIRSALIPAVVRVIESFRPENERLFDDRFANYFLPPAWRGIVKLLLVTNLNRIVFTLWERRFPGAIGNLLCRTRFIDDALRNALKKDLKQVVILGAGFDSRAYRIPRIESTRVFEVDLPTTLSHKQTRLRQVFGMLPSHVVFVPIDFNKQKLEDAMTSAGFCTGVNTFFIWQGVTQFITAEAVDATLRYIARATKSGSKIVLTYIHLGIVDGSTHSDIDHKFYFLAKRSRTPWIFGFDPANLAEYLAARGLELVEDIGVLEYRALYNKRFSSEENIFKGENIALARIVNMS